MKEHPILFSSAMVCAILDGRKSVTRRVLKPQPTQPLQPYENVLTGEVVWSHADGYGPAHGEIEYSDGTVRPLAVAKCRTWRPPAQAGDRLWVREAWAYVPRTAYGGMVPFRDDPRPGHEGMCAVYRADWERSQPGQWKPSIHMPRWASRLTLEVCSVRAERVNEISEADAAAEGAEPLPCVYLRHCNSGRCPRHGPDPHRVAFAKLWDSLNARRGYPFDAGCYVWVISFRVLPADPARAGG